jgi:hypothetical protein
MGYTHYWTQTRDFPKKEWLEIGHALHRIIDAQNVPIGNYAGDPGTQPKIGADEIGFNGIGAESHETFYVTRERAPLEEWQRNAGIAKGWAFCKTAYKPYDTVVTAFLIYLHNAQGFRVGSDGNTEDWKPGLALVTKAFPAKIWKIPPLD